MIAGHGEGNAEEERLESAFYPVFLDGNVDLLHAIQQTRNGRIDNDELSH